MTGSRTESDLLGNIDVPAGALYGAQTQRAILNFPTAGTRTIGSYPRFIEALLCVKRAAALANLKTEHLTPEIGAAIASAASELIARPQPESFPVHRLAGGGGTSSNMNVNEVLTNLAEESLGGKRGEYKRVHPLDHVNRHQSTNDVVPTACRMAILLEWPQLERATKALVQVLQAKAAQSHDQPRIARTCLQDAVDVTFGDLFGSYAAAIERTSSRMGAAIECLHAVNLGGTAVGRSGDVPKTYFDAIIPALREAAGDPAYTRAENLFDAAQNPDDMLAVSSAHEVLARTLIKICKDLRLLCSGPEAGLGEIRLPAVQPGSSMMPGKVNPVIPEFAMQLCFQAIGCHAACVPALDHGELDLNVWESTIVFNILDAMDLLAAACNALTGRCIATLEIVSGKNRAHVETIIPLLTRLMQQHGYSTISAICKQAGGDPAQIRELLKKKGLVH
jgi:aspartate ammonia-lyase